MQFRKKLAAVAVSLMMVFMPSAAFAGSQTWTITDCNRHSNKYWPAGPDSYVCLDVTYKNKNDGNGVVVMKLEVRVNACSAAESTNAIEIHSLRVYDAYSTVHWARNNEYVKGTDQSWETNNHPCYRAWVAQGIGIDTNSVNTVELDYKLRLDNWPDKENNIYLHPNRR